MKWWWSECFFGHDAVEIFTGDLSSVTCCSLKHFFEFLDVHGLAEFFGNSTNIVRVDDSGVVVVEEVKDLVDAILIWKTVTLDSLSPSLEVIPSRNS